MIVTNDLTIGAGATLDVKFGGDYQITVGSNWINAGTFNPENGKPHAEWKNGGE